MAPKKCGEGLLAPPSLYLLLLFEADSGENDEIDNAQMQDGLFSSRQLVSGCQQLALQYGVLLCGRGTCDVGARTSWFRHRLLACPETVVPIFAFEP